VFAQYKLEVESNLPRPGDEIVKYQVFYKTPGEGGTDVFWNFSDLEGPGEAYELVYDTINGILTGAEHRTRYYYKLLGDSLLLSGYENATTLMQNFQPELVQKFPVSYNDSSFTRFRGQGRYGDRLQVDVMGTVSSRADALGRMALPGNDTLKHVLRIHTLKRAVEEIQPLPFHSQPNDALLLSPPAVSADSIDSRLQTDSLVMEIETYRWYAQGYRYPVFETVKSRNIIGGVPKDCFATAFFFPPQKHYYLEDDEENPVQLEEMENESDPWKGLIYNIFPNPAKSFLEVELYLPSPASVRIQLRTTMGLIVKEANRGVVPAGEMCRSLLDVYTLPVDDYILDVWLDDYLISRMILKR
jgi:hypothetical protein